MHSLLVFLSEAEQALGWGQDVAQRLRFAWNNAILYRRAWLKPWPLASGTWLLQIRIREGSRWWLRYYPANRVGELDWVLGSWLQAGPTPCHCVHLGSSLQAEDLSLTFKENEDKWSNKCFLKREDFRYILSHSTCFPPCLLVRLNYSSSSFPQGDAAIADKESPF